MVAKSPAERSLRKRPIGLPEQVMSSSEEPSKTEVKVKSKQVVWGKTPSGEVFRVPNTHDVLTALFHPSYPKSHFDIFNLALLGSQLLLFLFLPSQASRIFFFFYFFFWRLAYDIGLGWVLTKQSKRRWIVKEVQRRGWLDEERRPAVRNWIKAQLVGKMGKDYCFDDLPVEYNTWLLFRQVVDVILINDFVAYCMFAFSCFRIPRNLYLGIHILRWLGGLFLIAFNLWVKTEAHNVVKDYGWYWGDTFFQRGALVFDGVFELAPHPMYSVGYAGYYGLSLISGSYAVLFVSLVAHAAQFSFLVFFENPHIERTYGKRKLIAQRLPVNYPALSSPQKSPDTEVDEPVSVCPSAGTDSETAAETEVEVEIDTEMEPGQILVKPPPALKPHNSSDSSKPITGRLRRISQHLVSQYDLLNKYFRRDPLLLCNLDMFRAPDFMLVIIVLYAVVISAMPSLSRQTYFVLHFVHALSWCLFRCFGLGLLLRAQSRTKFLVRHFVKNYHYPSADDGSGAVLEAFSNWKIIYNLSLCMTYASFAGLVWQTYSIPRSWLEGDVLLRHILGALMVALHVWASMESFEVLGVFGWFFGDFFMEDFAAHLQYTGIYRYVNNPEVLNGAAFFGLAFVSGSKWAISLAAIRYISHWWFLRYVENPHMRKLYGDSLRKEAGFVKVIRDVASKNARLFQTRAGRHGSGLKQVAREVKGKFDKVYGETAEVVEEILAKSTPIISEVVQDTKDLFEHSRERLVITRIASDLSSLDVGKYSVTIVSKNPDGALRFHLGEPITIDWKAPRNHSRHDWIGIYRIGANKSSLVTKTSSMGMWVPVHDDEWDGDMPLGLDRPAPSGNDSEQGSIVFKSDALPWKIGRYEVRYHHDGKYNVISLAGPLEIYVDEPATLDFDSVRRCLLYIVPLCLDADPSLVPVSSLRGDRRQLAETSDWDDGRDPDDFRFWTERQAKRICLAIKQIFCVEYAPQVVLADANLTALANRILISKEILES